MSSLTAKPIHPVTIAVLLALAGCGGGGGGGENDNSASATTKAGDVAVAQAVSRECGDANHNFHCDPTETPNGSGPRLTETFDRQSGDLLLALTAPEGLTPSAYHSVLRVMQAQEPDQSLVAAQHKLIQRLGKADETLEKALLNALQQVHGRSAAERVHAVTDASMRLGKAATTEATTIAELNDAGGWAKAGPDESPRSLIWQNEQLIIGTGKPNRLLLKSSGQIAHGVDLLPVPRMEAAMISPTVHAMGGASGVIVSPPRPTPTPRPTPSIPTNPGTGGPTPTEPPAPVVSSDGMSQLVTGQVPDTVYAALTATTPATQQVPCRSLVAGEQPKYGVFRLGIVQRPKHVALNQTLACFNDGISQLRYQEKRHQLLALDTAGRRLLQLDGDTLALRANWPLPAKPVAMDITRGEDEVWVVLEGGEVVRMAFDGRQPAGFKLEKAPARLVASPDHVVLDMGNELQIYHQFGGEPQLARRLSLPVPAVALAANQDWLAVALNDGRVRVYHLPSGLLRAEVTLAAPATQLTLQGDVLHLVSNGNRLYQLIWTPRRR